MAVLWRSITNLTHLVLDCLHRDRGATLRLGGGGGGTISDSILGGGVTGHFSF